MDGQKPEVKRGDYGTDRLGHFYAEVRDVVQRNRDGVSRQKIIREAVRDGDPLLLELPTRDNPNAVRVSTIDHRQIGHLPGAEGISVLTRLSKRYRYAAFADQVLEWEIFEGRTQYGVNALIFRVASDVSGDEIRDYVHENFHSHNPRLESAYVKAFGLTPKCEAAVSTCTEDVIPTPVQAPPPPPPPKPDIPKLIIALKSAVVTLAQFNEAFALLLKELGVSSVQDEERVKARVQQLADTVGPVTEDTVRELLKHNPE